MGHHYVVKRPPVGSITVPELIARWPVSESTARRWLKEHKKALPSKKFNGNRKCVPLDKVLAFEEAHGIPLVSVPANESPADAKAAS